MEEKFKITFQKYIGRIMGLLEVSNNNALKREVKKTLWDLSDELEESLKKEEESENGKKSIHWNI